MTRKSKWLIGGAAVVTLGGAALNGAAGHARSETDTTVSRADAEVLALDVLWPSHRDAVCAQYNSLHGVTRGARWAIVVHAFEDGAGRSMSDAARSHLIELIDEAC